MSDRKEPKVTIWLGPKGSRMIGYDVQGQPVYATDDGAGVGTKLTGTSRPADIPVGNGSTTVPGFITTIDDGVTDVR